LTHDTDGDVLSANQWAYDESDRITQATTPDGVSDYSYDKTDQLTQAEHSEQADESYTYDDNGNRINTGYVTGENNQLQSDGTYNYEYDKEGNRVKRTAIATGEVTNYEWDYRNRLVGVETKDSNGDVTANSAYTYDVFDNRIAKSVDADGNGADEAVVERFVYDGEHIALTFDGSGNQTERFLHGTQIDQVLAQENESGEVLWALTDHQGSVRMLLDNNGNVVNNITYDAFGNITLETNPEVNFRFSYTGREFDAETGLYNYRSRYYDPAVGEFISEDTIGFAGGDVNLSRYVHNNPVNWIDPTGTSDVRWPFNASLENNSNQDVYILNSTEKEDRIEVLHPGASTPNSPGHSKDPDGVWVNDDGWKFYPLKNNPLRGAGSRNHFVDSDNQVGYGTNNPDGVITGRSERIPKLIKPWNGDPNSKDSPATRGRRDGIGIYPPDTRITYPDASRWEPVPPENTKKPKNLGQNGLERLINFGDDSLLKLEEKIKRNDKKEEKKGNSCKIS
jgi:RHS repeat-associated protein